MISGSSWKLFFLQSILTPLSASSRIDLQGLLFCYEEEEPDLNLLVSTSVEAFNEMCRKPSRCKRSREEEAREEEAKKKKKPKSSSGSRCSSSSTYSCRLKGGGDYWIAPDLTESWDGSLTDAIVGSISALGGFDASASERYHAARTKSASGSVKIDNVLPGLVVKDESNGRVWFAPIVSLRKLLDMLGITQKHQRRHFGEMLRYDKRKAVHGWTGSTAVVMSGDGRRSVAAGSQPYAVDALVTPATISKPMLSFKHFANGDPITLGGFDHSAQLNGAKGHVVSCGDDGSYSVCVYLQGALQDLTVQSQHLCSRA